MAATTEQPASPATPEPMPTNITSVQPGGGVCYSIELAWGRWRRWYLARFRPGYVERMAKCRQGDAAGAPHPILDPRDLKFCRNQCTCDWAPADDAFAWRGRLPFARWGLAELLLMGGGFLALTIVAGWICWYAAIVPAVLFGLVVWFFRDPPRRVPQEAGLVVSPADGKISEITELENDPIVGGPAVRIGIFLSIFNVHLNRAPVASRVIGLRYHPGKFLNAIDPQSAILNENMVIVLEEDAPPHRKMVVRQIAGMYARRIVCALRPGETLARGDKVGMIKLGSRTELILPRSPGLAISVVVGDRVRAGASVLAQFSASDGAKP